MGTAYARKRATIRVEAPGGFDQAESSDLHEVLVVLPAAAVAPGDGLGDVEVQQHDPVSQLASLIRACISGEGENLGGQLRPRLALEVLRAHVHGGRAGGAVP